MPGAKAEFESQISKDTKLNPLTIASGGGGESDLHACGPSASFSFHLAISSVTPARSLHKSSGVLQKGIMLFM